MKQKVILLMILALGMCCINVSAQAKRQTPVKKATTRPTTATTTKERQVGSDGYIWYRLKKGNLYGAQNIEGKEIIPIKYTKIEYKSSIVRYFYVENGDFAGIYTRKGSVVVSTDRHYTSISDGIAVNGVIGKVCWKAKKNDGGLIVLDAKGNEAFSAEQYSDVSMRASFDDKSEYNSNICYFKVTRNGKYGICDLNGKELYPPKYTNCYMDRNGTRIRGYNSSSDDEFVDISYNTATRFDYQTYDDLYNYSYNSSSSSSLSSSSSSSSNSSSSTSSSSFSGSSSNSNSGNNTTTIHVEHHHDPVPVQQWQACFACGGMGTMGCDNCGGGGTKYIGDRLHRCSRCNGRGIIPCNVCYGNKGQYITVYK